MQNKEDEMKLDMFITALQLGEITDPVTDGIMLHDLSMEEIKMVFSIVQGHSRLNSYLIPVEEGLDA
jgi:hypothetical protein